MRIALGMDGLLCNLESRLQLYKDKLEIDKDPFSSQQLLNDESFWAFIKPYNDLTTLLWDIQDSWKNPEIYVLTERPKRLAMVTEAWLKKHFDIPKQVIYSSIKRFDCRINDIEIHIDVEFKNEDWYQYQGTKVIKWER